MCRTSERISAATCCMATVGITCTGGDCRDAESRSCSEDRRSHHGTHLHAAGNTRQTRFLYLICSGDSHGRRGLLGNMSPFTRSRPRTMQQKTEVSQACISLENLSQGPALMLQNLTCYKVFICENEVN